MDERRAKTLEALSTFIDSQRTLLTRTQANIVRLTQLRNDIAQNENDECSVTAYGSQLDGTGYGEPEEQSRVLPAIPKEINWSLYASADPAPLTALATSARIAYTAQRKPSLKQSTPLSDLQQLVKDSRVTMLDPILASLPPLSSDEDEEPPDPEELRRIREREKIRELKRRRIHGDSGFIYGLSGLGLRKPGAEAVFVRRDQEDETAEVDIGLGDQINTNSSEQPNLVFPNAPTKVKKEEHTSSIPHYEETELLDDVPSATKGSRARRPTRKATDSRTQCVKTSSTKKTSTQQTEAPDATKEEDIPKTDKKGKLRPETYKQAWSVSEQHLLERLLEEIPDGEKNRWAKISQAMNGKRTARQVASRVQKYYEKLKRFGLDVGGSQANT